MFHNYAMKASEGAWALLPREQEIRLIDSLRQQDIGQGVEWEEIRVSFHEWAGETQQMREQEEESWRREGEGLGREGEGLGVLLTLGKWEQETREVVPDCVSQTSQGSPLTQNPLLSALLFAKKPAAMKEKASSQPLPDLQYYLDVLAAHIPESPCAPLVEPRENNNYLAPEPHRNTETGPVSGAMALEPPHAGSAEIMQMHRHTLIADLNELAPPLTQSLPDTSQFKQTFSGSEELAQSFLDTNICSSPPDNLNHINLTACEEIFNFHTQREVCPDRTRTATPAHMPCRDEFTQKDSSHNLSCLVDGTTTFHLKNSIEHVNLDTSLNGDDTFNTSQSEDRRCIQSYHTELFDWSLLSDAEEVQSHSQPCGTEAIPQQLTPNPSHPAPFSDPSQHPVGTDPSPRAKMDAQTCLPARRGHRNRRTFQDEQNAQALQLPLSMDDIVGLSVDAFNEAVGANELSQAQLSLIRDIRRRGKNKMAAQSCRKRKQDKMVDLEAEVEALREQSKSRKRERENHVKALRDTKQKLRKLYCEVFSQLRDECGNPYSPKEYTLQHSSDGYVYLLPRKTNVNYQRKTQTPTCEPPEENTGSHT
ncbi:nuclear factor erythroid 2-related factor 2b isoform X2 [Brachyhypopomus gauderio]|uniref:nuclear factor erythroid 2-related factor 2b isoform X2 n=1 Tax=Brachyhypopomus gauderio TaxID=698409 RepID=UPI004042B21D